MFRGVLRCRSAVPFCNCGGVKIGHLDKKYDDLSLIFRGWTKSVIFGQQSSTPEFVHSGDGDLRIAFYTPCIYTTVYNCLRPLRPFLTTFLDPQKKHFLSISMIIFANVRKSVDYKDYILLNVHHA